MRNKKKYVNDIQRRASNKALKVLKEDFFWNKSDDFAPFGSDEGNDAYYHFYAWRKLKLNRNIKCVGFIMERIKHQNISISDLLNTDLEKISAEVEMGVLFLDYDIIAVCFGQLILEGRIDSDLLNLSKVVIKRQMTDYVLDRIYFSEDDKLHRKQILEKELDILEKI